MSANRLKLNADKTELLWAGSRRCCLTLGNRGRKLQLGDDTIVPANDVNVLVCVSSDLTMDKHVSNVCSAGFYRLRQLRRVRDHWTRSRLQPSWSSRPASITAMYC